MADALNTAAFSEQIGSIYDCVLDPNRWRQTLIGLGRAFETQVATLTLVDRRQGRLLIEETVGVEKRWLGELQKHIPEINKILAAFYSHLPQDAPRIVSRDIPVAYCQTSPYIQEFLRPQGIVDSMLYYLMDTPTRYSAFAVSKSERLFGEREIELGALLLPHIQRAVTISNVLDAHTIEGSRMAAALDGLRCAVILSDEQGTVLHANRAAEAMLRAGSLVTATGGVLHARSGSAAAELRVAIAQAARNEADIGKTGLATRLTEPDVPPIFAHVLPMTGSELRTRLQPAAAAAIFIGAMPGENDAANLMTAAFGLTPAEKRVLAGLLAGRTLAETAAALGVAQTTAKSQLERIFSKTGVSRQADLILLATRLTPPTSSAS